MGYFPKREAAISLIDFVKAEGQLNNNRLVYEQSYY